MRGWFVRGNDLVRLFDNEPLYYSQLARLAMMQIAIAPTWKHCKKRVDGSQLSELQSKWEATDLLSMMEPFMPWCGQTTSND